MSDITIYGNEVQKVFGDVALASNDQVVCTMFDDGTEQFALNHDLSKPSRIQLFFNEKQPDGSIVTRSWNFDPIKFNQALTTLVRDAKMRKEESFI